MSNLYTLSHSSNRRAGFIAQASNTTVEEILNNHLTGVVHSTFTNSFNVIFGDKIIHIGASDNGIAPFGIGMFQEDARNLTKQISVGQQVRWEKASQNVIFHQEISLSLQQAVLVNHSLHASTYNVQILQENLKYISNILLQNNWQTGLVSTDNGKKEIIHSLVFETDFNQADSAALEIEKLLLFARGAVLTNVEIESIFNYWIGRGPGLTPSGDDLMTGVCAMLSMLDGANENFIEALKAYLLKHGEKRTTQISLEYLTYAVNHEFHSHLVDFAKQLLKRKDAELLIGLEKVGKLGHTSGTDTLIGILLGIKAITTN